MRSFSLLFYIDNGIYRTMKGRKEKNTLCKSLLTYTLFLCIYCGCIYCVSSFTVKTCDEIGSFQQMFGISLPICAEECFRRQRCQLFMFHFGMRHCALKNDIDVQSLGEEGPVCRYYTRDDWSQIDLGPCNGHTCGETKRCTSKTDDEFECVKSECSTPCEIADATLLSITHSIGTTNRYKCNNGYVGHGTPTITCGNNAEWSVTDFRCISKQSCPTPEQHYNNADLTHVEGSLYTPGTVLTFTCREGYRNMVDEWAVECQAGLIWNPTSIGCCPDESTHKWNTSCIAIVDAGVVTSYDGAVDYCESINGRMVWAHKENEDKFNNTSTDLVLQDTTISQIKTDWNYNACAAANNAIGVANQSFKNNINEAIKNGWEGKRCWLGTMWSPGQPDLNGDDCVARDIHETSHKNHHDLPCNFNSSFRVGFLCRFPKIIV